MKLKRWLVLGLIITLCVPNVPAGANTKPSTVGNHNVPKTAGYTPIYTIADLAGINNNPSGNYVLMNDIDITQETKVGGSWDSGHGWMPLNEFSGTLDGAGHRIIGMHIYGDLEEDLGLKGAGLFSGINNGSVKNLGMIQVNIDNVTVAWNAYGTYGIGAIAGYMEGQLADYQISNCYVTGNVTGNDAEDEHVGGLAGYAFDTAVANSYNAANVSGNGIIGYNEEGFTACSYCYNVGNVTKSPISSHFDKPQKSIYGLQGKSLRNKYTTMLTEAQMGIQSMFAGFDFGNVWEIDSNSTYKYPQLKSNRHQRVEGIEIISAPAKTIYNRGEKIDVSGGIVNLIYEGSYTTTIIMTDDMLKKYDTAQTGEQDIIVQCGGKETAFRIMVQESAVKAVNITGTGNQLSKGTSMQLNAVLEPANAAGQALTWSSSNPQIAAVDESGKVTALQAGDVIITAAAANGVSGQYAVKVTVPCNLLMLEPSELTIYKGDTAALVAMVSPLDTTDSVSWHSSNTNIVTVDNKGGLIGKAVGSTRITASAGNKTAICNVTVKQKLNDFSIKGVVDKEYTGQALKQSIIVTDGKVVLENEKDYTVSYSDNIKVGTAKVHVTGKGYYEGNIEKSFQITGQGASDEISTKPTAAPTVKPTAAPAIKPTNAPVIKPTDTPAAKPTVTPSIKPSDEPDIEPSDKPITTEPSDETDIEEPSDETDIKEPSDETDNDYSDKISIGKTKISKLNNVKGKKLKVTFKKLKAASGYEIRYSTKSNMAGSKTKRTTKTSYTLSSLKKGKNYYVQVRAYTYNSSGKKVYGKWSTKKKCKIKR